jgi:hypothetical protein
MGLGGWIGTIGTEGSTKGPQVSSQLDDVWWWYMIYGYGSIPINTIFRGMNIHLPAILMFTRGTRFWHTAIWIYHSMMELLWNIYGNKATRQLVNRCWMMLENSVGKQDVLGKTESRQRGTNHPDLQLSIGFNWHEHCWETTSLIDLGHSCFDLVTSISCLSQHYVECVTTSNEVDE